MCTIYVTISQSGREAAGDRTIHSWAKSCNLLDVAGCGETPILLIRALLALAACIERRHNMDTHILYIVFSVIIPMIDFK